MHIVRHGQTSWNAVRRIQGQLESELDEFGRQQAMERGKDFRHMCLAAVYSSSSVRARQTTALILAGRRAAIGADRSPVDSSTRNRCASAERDFAATTADAVSSIEIAVDDAACTRETAELITCLDDLREVRLGIWEGRMWADIEKAYPDQVEAYGIASPDFEVEGAEKMYEVQLRGVRAIESIISAHKNAPDDANLLIVSHGDIIKTILANYVNLPLARLHELPGLPNCAHCTVNVTKDKRIIEQIAGIPFEQTPWKSAQA
jgi:probable phosphoglycerate mutase